MQQQHLTSQHLLCRILDHLHLEPVLQTSIQAEGFRSLREGEEVEFDVEPGDDGRNKAVNVTGPGGAPPLVSAGSRCLPHTNARAGRPLSLTSLDTSCGSESQLMAAASQRHA